MKRLMLVRHGESEWNAGRRLQGQADIGLSERGRLQAQALIPTIAALRPDQTVTSDLIRARETAALLGFPEAVRSAELREIDVGAWTGELIDNLKARDAEAYRGWRAGTFTPPAGEAWSAFRGRISLFLHGLLAGPAARILLVSHGGVLRAALESLIALPPERIVPAGPASLTVIRQARPNGKDEFRLEVFNFSPDGPILDAPD